MSLDSDVIFPQYGDDYFNDHCYYNELYFDIIGYEDARVGVTCTTKMNFDELKENAELAPGYTVTELASYDAIKVDSDAHGYGFIVDFKLGPNNVILSKEQMDQIEELISMKEQYDDAKDLDDDEIWEMLYEEISKDYTIIAAVSFEEAEAVPNSVRDEIAAQIIENLSVKL